MKSDLIKQKGYIMKRIDIIVDNKKLSIEFGKSVSEGVVINGVAWIWDEVVLTRTMFSNVKREVLKIMPSAFRARYVKLTKYKTPLPEISTVICGEAVDIKASVSWDDDIATNNITLDDGYIMSVTTDISVGNRHITKTYSLNALLQMTLSSNNNQQLIGDNKNIVLKAMLMVAGKLAGTHSNVWECVKSHTGNTPVVRYAEISTGSLSIEYPSEVIIGTKGVSALSYRIKCKINGIANDVTLRNIMHYELIMEIFENDCNPMGDSVKNEVLLLVKAHLPSHVRHAIDKAKKTCITDMK